MNNQLRSAPLTLTINGGSSSTKFALLEVGDSLRRIVAGGIERIGMPEVTLQVKGLNPADDVSRSVAAPDHTVAVPLDEKPNAANEGVVSAAACRVAVRVIRTDEERMIAETVCRVLDLG